MKVAVVTILLFVSSFFIGFFVKSYFFNQNESVREIIPAPLRPLDKYTIENISKADVKPAKINIENTISENDKFASKLFSFSFDPTLQNRTTKKVTGLINIPKSDISSKKFPLVIMLRGYVDQTIYQTGVGTKRAGEYFANNGFITVAPDFLGYAGSDSESGNIFETRFQTYTTALTLLRSVKNIPEWDGQNVFIWAHSNGGQVALTLLEITGEEIPTVLWAPVSKPFPYSVLYYTDESEDGGKLIRRELSNFEDLYDTDLYSIHKYWDRIKAPFQIHQGTADDAVPVVWSNSLVEKLRSYEEKGEKTKIEYYTYPGADHNLNPSWNTVVERSFNFYQSSLK